MRDKLKAYLDDLFRGAPDTEKNRELREKLTGDSLDKYDDLVRGGTPDNAAFNLVVGELGDVGELMREIRQPAKQTAQSAAEEPQGPEKREKYRRRRGVCVAVAVMLYILSVLPPILLSGSRYSSTLAPALMFVIVAVATGILLIGVCVFKKPHEHDPDSPDGDRKNDPLFSSLNGLLWALVLVAYFVLSFTTGAWTVTWLMFPIGAALSGVLKAIFDIVKGGRR